MSKTDTTHELMIPAYAASGIVNNLNWRENKDAQAGEAMEAMEAQLPEGYWDADEDDCEVYTVRLSSDHAALVRAELELVEAENEIDISPAFAEQTR